MKPLRPVHVHVPVHVHCHVAPRQGGALIVMFALMVIVLLGFAGLTLDLAQLYSRRLELQNVADAAALAAAGPLDGSTAGFDNAATQAGMAAQNRKYAYRLGIAWSDAALSFGADPDGATWYDRAGAKALPAPQQATLVYTRVDTRQLDAAYGQVGAMFMRLLSDSAASAGLSAQAVAGRRSLRVTPLAVCALSAMPADKRIGTTPPELLEYGFRRGVGYNLLALSPLGATPLNYLVDPVQPSAGAAPVSATAAAPFVCSGSMPVALLPATLHVSWPFPIGLAAQLNSRFNTYGGTSACNPLTAPPDTNIKAYPYSGSGWWSSTTAPTGQTAANTTSPLLTVADVPAAAPNAGSYGVLWSYAKAVQWAATAPAAGYTTYAKTAWPSLYPVLGGAAPTETSADAAVNAMPYNSTSAKFNAAPTSPANVGIAARRVLNIPLLACTNAAGGNSSAALLGIGRFFMTVPAAPGSASAVPPTKDAVSAEFAGVVAQSTLGGPAELIR